MHKALLLAVSLPLVACAAQTTAPVPPALIAQTPEPAAPAKAASTVERVVVSSSRVSGACVTTTLPDGTIKVAFDNLENGRGPHVDATLKLGADGSIASLEAHGHHTMGTKVDETFVREGSRATWKSLEESGSREVSGSAFFVPISDVPETIGLLARALLQAKAPLPLLPGGTATIEKTTETTVRAGGRERHLIGYAIVGLEFAPTHVWMNDDGTWFGVASEWYSIVPKGFEGVVDQLVAFQNEVNRKRDERLAKEHAHTPPASGLAYTHARVLDVEHGKWFEDRTVVVVGNTIQSVGAAGSKIPKDAEIVDLAGKALVPGLWDMHSHLADADGVLDIASGITTARDVGNDPDKLDDYKKRYDSGLSIGPHVIRFGFIEGRNPKAASSKVTAETEAEAKAAVETYAKRGYEGIKIYNSVKPELVPLLAKEAHARGMMVTGHVPVHMLANEVVSAGYDGIEHINMLFLNFFATHETDTRDTTRFTLVGDKASSLDLESKPVLDFFALLQKNHTIIDPTVGVFEGLLAAEQGKVPPGLEATVDRLPVQVQRWFLTGGVPTEGKVELYRSAFEKLGVMVKALHDAKIPVVAGTDSFGGLMLHHELALYVRSGISAIDALRFATIDAARSMKMDKKTGSIAAGKSADLFVVDGDPLAHIDDIGKVVSAMRGGVIYPSAPLYAAVGVRPIATANK